MLSCVVGLRAFAFQKSALQNKKILAKNLSGVFFHSNSIGFKMLSFVVSLRAFVFQKSVLQKEKILAKNFIFLNSIFGIT
ncbi:hypothetical protein SPONN_1626 [uncultured Candidatus Thioglobus sp.]|nr:hypothetical protein SPONN_1626 [uncultured Candidatus Thioglobus sp.]